MITLADRQVAIGLIAEAVCAGARRHKACAVLDITVRTLQRWEAAQGTGVLEDQRKAAGAYRTPGNKLSEAEKERILEICNQPEYASLPPSQIVPLLADRSVYVASESTFYRVLRASDQVQRRGKAALPKDVARPQGYLAEGPNQVWSWDITFLASSIKGLFYRLYLVMDVFSRKIVGWEVYAEETATHAAAVIRRACLSESVHEEGLVLHSDNGGPMKGAMMLATLQKLGVVPSFSRPSVSDDNPYSESLFRTMKYRPAYPGKPFESIEAARQWVHAFVQWYNHAHRHSGIRHVTPQQRHSGEEKRILAARRALYHEARQRTPQRWSCDIRNWNPVASVWLNPPKEHQAGSQQKEAA